jgi:hypothetical protein
MAKSRERMMIEEFFPEDSPIRGMTCRWTFAGVPEGQIMLEIYPEGNSQPNRLFFDRENFAAFHEATEMARAAFLGKRRRR